MTSRCQFSDSLAGCGSDVRISKHGCSGTLKQDGDDDGEALTFPHGLGDRLGESEVLGVTCPPKISPVEM
jgi:hypothetical protein